MPEDGKEIYLNALEVGIMRAFFNHIYLTDVEMADVLYQLANKLEGRAYEDIVLRRSERPGNRQNLRRRNK
jgi:hypothetical protein